jgi:hypothetical protein
LPKGATVSVYTLGFWGTVDQSLQWIGKGLAEFLTRRSPSAEENALIGGALVCAVFGAITGFAISDIPPRIGVTGGAILGGLLGACTGVVFGSVVVTIDHAIKHTLGSLNSK